MIVLDTDFLIDLAKGKPGAVKKLQTIANHVLAISSINLTELCYGIFKQNESWEEEKFAEYLLLPFGQSEAQLAARIRVQLEKNGGRIGPEDEMIAATALAHQASLVTRNTKHFRRIKGLKTESW